jgi:hypothetical protein
MLKNYLYELRERLKEMHLDMKLRRKNNVIVMHKE